MAQLIATRKKKTKKKTVKHPLHNVKIYDYAS